MNVNQYLIPEFENTMGFEGPYFLQLRESSMKMSTNRNTQYDIFPAPENKTLYAKTKDGIESSCPVRCF